MIEKKNKYFQNLIGRTQTTQMEEWVCGRKRITTELKNKRNKLQFQN